MDDIELADDLMKIVPTWQYVDTTKAGYNKQYIETIIKLIEYIKDIKS